jgi:hypothetical protein
VDERGTMRKGDIIVTRVARHYALGRVNADRRTQTHVEAQNHRADALRLACELAGADHHVLIHEFAGSGHYIDVDCVKSFESDRHRSKPRAGR